MDLNGRVLEAFLMEYIIFNKRVKSKMCRLYLLKTIGNETKIKEYKMKTIFESVRKILPNSEMTFFFTI
jgi:hypothetical protein